MTQKEIYNIVDTYAAKMHWPSWEIRSISQHNHPQDAGIDGTGWLIELRLRLTDPTLLELRREGMLKAGADHKSIDELPNYIETDIGLVVEDSTGHVVSI